MIMRSRLCRYNVLKCIFTSDHKAYQNNTNHRYINRQYLQQRHSWRKHSNARNNIYTDISDYLPIFLLTKLTNNTKDDTIIKTRLYNDQTIATFRCSVNKIVWDDVYECQDPEECYKMFLNKITQAYDKAFPLFKNETRRKKYKPWITKGLKNSIQTKNKL